MSCNEQVPISIQTHLIFFWGYSVWSICSFKTFRCKAGIPALNINTYIAFGDYYACILKVPMETEQSLCHHRCRRAGCASQLHGSVMSYILGIVLLLASFSAQGAILLGEDYPYLIYNDDKISRYCMAHNSDPTLTNCWTAGKPTVCRVLTPEEGHIDCYNYTPLPRLHPEL